MRSLLHFHHLFATHEKMRFWFLVFACYCFSPQSLFAQVNYVTYKTASSKSRSAFDEAKQALDFGKMDKALDVLDKALKNEPNFIDAYWVKATVLNEKKDYAAAVANYRKALELDPEYEPYIRYNLAFTYWEMDNFVEAAKTAESYLNSNAKSEKYRREAKRLIANARFAQEAVKHPVPFDPKPVGNGINTNMDEYFPCLTADGSLMIFTRHDGASEDFYTAEWRDSAWQKAKPVDGVNTPQNEGAECIAADGSYILFSMLNRTTEGENFDLFWSQFKGGTWAKPNAFSAAINSKSWDAHPSMSADGKTLFFSSNRPGGQGDTDLWVATRKADGKWDAPQNLGADINTPFREECPFIHPDGQTLYFMSDGLPGMGANDLFFVRRQPDGSWGKPQNLGYPINTKRSEGTLMVSLDGKTAYFAAERPEGQGKNDIYQFPLPENARPRPVTYVKARVRDANTRQTLVAKVECVDLKSGQTMVSSNTKGDGSFLVCLPAGKDYALNVSKKGYLFASENFNLLETADLAKPFLLEIALQPLGDSTKTATAPAANSKPIVLRNVFFEKGSAALKAESATELDRLANLLADNPVLRVQINGHTDNVGDDKTNLALSENRAKSVYDYLLKKGIAADRLRFKGFGKSQPVESNDTEAGRQKNRRTEFEVW